MQVPALFPLESVLWDNLYPAHKWLWDVGLDQSMNRSVGGQVYPEARLVLGGQIQRDCW